tara:strand:- start:1356 stop:2045 length:690 start_codon:yes stop_codon:yes gene_type:complete
MPILKHFLILVFIAIFISACSSVSLNQSTPIEERKLSKVSEDSSKEGISIEEQPEQSSYDLPTGSEIENIEPNNSNQDVSETDIDETLNDSSESNDIKISNKPNTSIEDLLRDDSGPLYRRSIYFGFDSFSIKSEFTAIIEAHGSFLLSNPKINIVIQGNTDERGGSEYNIALGQKRAESVKRILSLMGVNDNQLEVVSLGKEKPKVLGSNEAAWAENRRVDIIYWGYE